MRQIIYGTTAKLADYWTWYLRDLAETEITLDIDQLESSSADLKFALHTIDQSYDRCQENYALIRRLCETCDLVFVFDTEIHHDHWTILDRRCPDNIVWVGPGYARGRWIMMPSFYQDLQKLYRRLPQVLDALDPYHPKSKKFDALLGRPKRHRYFVSQKIIEHGLEQDIIMRYDRINQEDSISQGWIWPDDVDPLPGTQPKIGADHVLYHGQEIMQALCLPLNIYNQSSYSIVAETNWNNDVHMLTEKSGRCLIAKRLFVVFAGKNYLGLLHDLGFETFGNIIDESYDDIENHNERWARAFEQVRFLCAQDPLTVLDRCRDRLEHNHNLIMNKNFIADTAQKMRFHISSFLRDLVHDSQSI